MITRFLSSHILFYFIISKNTFYISIEIEKVLFDHMSIYNYRKNFFVTESTKIFFQNNFLDFQRIKSSLDLHFFKFFFD
jgi:hypothetical protein